MKECKTQPDEPEAAANSSPGPPRIFVLTTEYPMAVQVRSFSSRSLGLEILANDISFYSSVQDTGAHKGLWQWLVSLAIPRQCYAIELETQDGPPLGASWELGVALGLVSYVALQQSALASSALQGGSLLISGSLDPPQGRGAPTRSVMDWPIKLAGAHDRGLLKEALVICPAEDEPVVRAALDTLLGPEHDTQVAPVNNTVEAIQWLARAWQSSPRQWLEQVRIIEGPGPAAPWASAAVAILGPWWRRLRQRLNPHEPPGRNLPAVERVTPRPRLQAWTLSRSRTLDRLPENLCDVSLRPIYRSHRFGADTALAPSERGIGAPAAQTLRAWVRGGKIPAWMPRDEGVLALLAPSGFGKTTLLDGLEQDVLQAGKRDVLPHSPGESRKLLPLRIEAGLVYRDLAKQIPQADTPNDLDDHILRLALAPLLLPGENVRDGWRALLDEFSVVVLLDELDELPGEALRSRVFEVWTHEFRTNGKREPPRRILHLHRLIIAARPESVRVPLGIPLVGLAPLAKTEVRRYAEQQGELVWRTIEEKQAQWGDEIRSLLRIPLYLYIICQAVRDQALTTQRIEHVDDLLRLMVDDTLRQALASPSQPYAPPPVTSLEALEAVARAELDPSQADASALPEALLRSRLISQGPDGLRFTHRVFWEWAIRMLIERVAASTNYGELAPLLYDPRVLDAIRRWPLPDRMAKDRAAPLSALLYWAWGQARNDDSVDPGVPLCLLEAALIMADVEAAAPAPRSWLGGWFSRSALPQEAESRTWNEQVNRYAPLFDELTNSERVQIGAWAFRRPCQQSRRLALKAWLGPRGGRRLRDDAVAALARGGTLQMERQTNADWRLLLAEAGCVDAVGTTGGPIYQARQTLRTAERGRLRATGRRVEKYLSEHLPTRQQRAAAFVARHPLMLWCLTSIVCTFAYLLGQAHLESITYGGTDCWIESLGLNLEAARKVTQGFGFALLIYPIGLFVALCLKRVYLRIFSKAIRVARRLIEWTRAALLWLRSGFWASDRAIARWQERLHREWLLIGDPTRDLEIRLLRLHCLWRCTYRLKLTDSERQRLFSPFLAALRERRSRLEERLPGTNTLELLVWERRYDRVSELALEFDIDVERHLEKLLSTAGVTSPMLSAANEAVIFPPVGDPLESYKRTTILLLSLGSLLTVSGAAFLSSNDVDPWFFLGSKLTILSLALCGLFLLTSLLVPVLPFKRLSSAGGARLRTRLVVTTAVALLVLPLLVLSRLTDTLYTSHLNIFFWLPSILIGAPYVVAMSYLFFTSDRTRVITSEWLLINARWLRVGLALILIPATVAAAWPHVRLEEMGPRLVSCLLGQPKELDAMDSESLKRGQRLVEEIEELADSVWGSYSATPTELATALSVTIGHPKLSEHWAQLWRIALRSDPAAEKLRGRLSVALAALVTYSAMRPEAEDPHEAEARRIWLTVISFIGGPEKTTKETREQRGWRDEVRVAVRRALLDQGRGALRAEVLANLQATVLRSLRALRARPVVCVEGATPTKNGDGENTSVDCVDLGNQIEMLRWSKGITPEIESALQQLIARLNAAASQWQKGNQDNKSRADSALFFSAMLSCQAGQIVPDAAKITARLMDNWTTNFGFLSRLLLLNHECSNQEAGARWELLQKIVKQFQSGLPLAYPTLWEPLQQVINKGEKVEVWVDQDKVRCELVQSWSEVMYNAAEAALATGHFAKAMEWSALAERLHPTEVVSTNILRAMAMSLSSRELARSADATPETIKQALQGAAAGYCQLHPSERSSWRFDGTLRSLRRMGYNLEHGHLQDLAAYINKPKRRGQSDELIPRIQAFEEALLSRIKSTPR